MLSKKNWILLDWHEVQSLMTKEGFKENSHLIEAEFVQESLYIVKREWLTITRVKESLSLVDSLDELFKQIIKYYPMNDVHEVKREWKETKDGLKHNLHNN